MTLISFGCSDNPKRGDSPLKGWMEKNGKLKVLSTTRMIEDLVSQIGGERVDSLCLIQGDLDPHSYELVKGDGEKLSFAALVFFNGLGLEHGASLSYQLSHHPSAVALGDLIGQKRPDLILVSEGQWDPHIWMDVSMWAEGVDGIAEALSEKDPEGRGCFEENKEAVKKKMLETHDQIGKSFLQVPDERRYLITSHDAFHYFGRAYLATPEERENGKWKERIAAPEGLAPDGQLSVAEIQHVLGYLMEHQVRVIFPEANVSREALKKIRNACRSKGLEVNLSEKPLFGDSMGEGDAYLQMMVKNGQNLQQEWSCYKTK